jgi:hypothetical protein
VMSVWTSSEASLLFATRSLPTTALCLFPGSRFLHLAKLVAFALKSHFYHFRPVQVIKVDLDLKTFHHNNLRFCQEPLLSLSHVPCLATEGSPLPQSANGSSSYPGPPGTASGTKPLAQGERRHRKGRRHTGSPHRSRLPAETLEAPSKPQRASHRACPAGNQPRRSPS